MKPPIGLNFKIVDGRNAFARAEHPAPVDNIFSRTERHNFLPLIRKFENLLLLLRTIARAHKPLQRSTTTTTTTTRGDI
jgi:hypothetical protein